LYALADQAVDGKSAEGPTGARAKGIGPKSSSAMQSLYEMRGINILKIITKLPGRLDIAPRKGAVSRDALFIYAAGSSVI
jgi:hypothetical protein